MPDPPEANDVRNNKAMGILAYLGFLVLIAIFTAKESKFVRYHANQGLVLALAAIAFGIAYSILVGILTALLLGIGAWGTWGVLSAVLGLLWLVYPALAVIGIVNAANGRCKPRPR